MGARIGTGVRLEIDTSLTATPAYKAINHEKDLSESFQFDFVDVMSKDTGGWKDGIKTFGSGDITVKAIDDTVAGTKLDFEEVFSYFMENNSSVGQGRKKMRLNTGVSGTSVAEFIGVITSCKRDNNSDGVAMYDFTVKVVSPPVLTPVV